MKHIILSDHWTWSLEPFPAYRVQLQYGRNQQARAFLPVKDVTPQYTFTVTNHRGDEVLYSGTDKMAAETALNEYNAQADRFYPASMTQSGPILPEGQFRVIKTREKGTILVVPGVDATPRALVFTGCAGGFRGGCGLMKSATTATILHVAMAGNACNSRIEVAAIMDVGQSIVFDICGRRVCDVYVCTYTGARIRENIFSREEWEQRSVMENDANGVAL